MAALSFACKSIRYTGSMWISIWVSEGQRFVQALVWCGLQGLGCSRISAVRLVQQHWEEHWLAVILSWKIPWSRFLGSFYCWWWIRTLTFLWKETVNSSSDSICLFGVELSYGCFDKDWNAISQQVCDLSARIERHQLELLKKKTTTTNHIRASCFIRSCMISRPHRLKKTSSMQSKCHMWLHHETNEKLSFYCYSPGWITTIFYL